MSPRDWERVPGPWRVIHAASSALILAAIAGAVVLALR